MLAQGIACLSLNDFTFHSFKGELLPKFVALTAIVAQAEIMSLLAGLITSINGNARAPSREAFSSAKSQRGESL
jgi:hypothetical protein